MFSYSKNFIKTEPIYLLRVCCVLKPSFFLGKFWNKLYKKKKREIKKMKNYCDNLFYKQKTGRMKLGYTF